MGRGVVLQTLERTLPDSVYDPYDYELNKDTDFKKLNPEQQANILADYFGLIEGYNQINFSLAWRNHKADNSQYIRQVMQPIISNPSGYTLVSNSTPTPLVPLIFLIY